MSIPDTEVVRAMFDAYRAQDRAAAERLLADDLVFTSPQDDHIDKAAYLERCFPTASHFAFQRLLEVVPAGGGGVFIRYEYELRTGGRFRNTERITVRGGRIVDIEVFFGGRISSSGSR